MGNKILSSAIHEKYGTLEQFSMLTSVPVPVLKSYIVRSSAVYNCNGTPSDEAEIISAFLQMEVEDIWGKWVPDPKNEYCFNRACIVPEQSVDPLKNAASKEAFTAVSWMLENAVNDWHAELYLRYFEGESLMDIAADVDVHYTRVMQIVRKIERTLSSTHEISGSPEQIQHAKKIRVWIDDVQN